MSFQVQLQEKYIAAADNTKVLLGVAGLLRLWGYKAENNTAAACYIQMFDAASTAAVTLGTTTPDYTIQIPPNTLSQPIFAPEEIGPIKTFANGCVFAVTTTRTGSTAPASGATVQFFYSQN